MKRLFVFILLINFIFGYSQKSSYSIHKVEKGQTLYAISKMYGQSIEEIKKINSPVDLSNLKFGQEIKIPSGSKPIDAKLAATSISTNSKTPLYNITHIVKSGESAYSISKQYAISVDLLMKTNHMQNSDVQLGQALIIPGSTGTTTIVKQESIKNNSVTKSDNTKEVVSTNKTVTPKNNDEDVDITDPTVNNLHKSTSNPIIINKDDNNKVVSNDNQSKIENTSKINTETKSESEAYNFSQISNKSFAEQFNTYQTNSSLTKKVNKGVASYMKDASDIPNYIAMYNSSPIGSIVKVKNLMNGHVIYVKIVGKLPDLDKNKDLNIKVSESAAKALGVVDEKFLNEIEYFISK